MYAVSIITLTLANTIQLHCWSKSNPSFATAIGSHRCLALLPIFNRQTDRQTDPSSLGSLLAHDDRPQLTVVPHQYHLLTAHHYGYHALWLCGLEEDENGVRVMAPMSHDIISHHLSALVNEYNPEFEPGQSWVTSTHTRAADNIGIHQELPFTLTLECREPFLIRARQLPLLSFQLHQLVQLRVTEKESKFEEEKEVEEEKEDENENN